MHRAEQDAVELLPRDGSAKLFHNFLSAGTADYYFSQLLQHNPWEQRAITMFGKQVNEPRLSTWHSVDNLSYLYSGLLRTPASWTPMLSELLLLCQLAASANFNSVLINLYRDGNDSMGWHADNEKSNGSEPMIASISLGESRRFDLRHRESKETIRTDLTHGSLLLMSGKSQDAWLHQVPKSKPILEPRINLTFRWVYSTL
ncbi:MAG: alpha-ketoglutarate-dependent dioxygenase AlkB [Ilumatobacteraceae bacterium]|nr:alpha-ketoglutarate-dependent dioxygenase AlkB [Ilumatobacteraceae bacterium]